MTENKNVKQFDLEKRTRSFALEVRNLIRSLPKTLSNIEDGKQVVRSSGSVGANYIEANEALSKKDFIMRIKICRKEAKETTYWLSLLYTDDDPKAQEQVDMLKNESIELMKIFGSILKKCE